MSHLLHHAAVTPERAAFVLGNGTFVETFGELELRSRRIALALRRLGLREGDCVALLMGNHPQIFDLVWGALRLGLYVTPINWHLAPPEVAYIVGNCEARVLIADPLVADVAVATRALLGSVDAVRTLSAGGAIEGFEPLESLLTDPADASLENQRTGSIMLYSSGTTGRPKGVRKPLMGRAFDDPDWNGAQARFMRIFGARDGDRYFTPSPMYHAAPLRSCVAVHVMGGTAFSMARFDPEACLRILQDQRVESSQWVPTHFRRLLELPDTVKARYTRPDLRLAIHAAAPCPPSDKRAMIEWWGPVLLEYYAGTEGGGTSVDSKDWLAHPGTVGRPWGDTKVAVFDEHGEPVSRPGQDGAIYFHDPLATSFSYFKDEEKTRGIHRGAWFTLGDIGHLDADGFLFLTDRQSDMIISGGVNIYPLETENALLEHPAVADVAVIGVADAEMGEAVKAVVRLKPGLRGGASLGAELIGFARARIAHFKCPKTVDFVEHLPRTETGKLQRRVLREGYRALAEAAL